MDEEDGCKGYSTNTQDGTEYDCEYEFADDCGDCMFGGHGGTHDPRIDLSKEDDPDDCSSCKHDEYCLGGCESGFYEKPIYKFEKKEEVV